MHKRAQERVFFHSFYEKNRLNFLASVFLQALMATVGISVSWILGAVLDAVAGGDGNAIRRMSAIMAAFLFSYFLIEAAGARVKARYVHRGLRQYKECAFERLSHKSIQAFTVENTGTYLSVLTNDAGSIEENYLNRSVLLVFYCLQFVLSLGMMLIYSRLLTLAVIFLSLLPIAVSALMGKGLVRRERRVSDLNEAFTSKMKDLLNGFSVIKSFQAEAQAQRLFDRDNAELETAREQRRWYAGLLGAVSHMTGTTVQFGIFLIGAMLAVRGDISVGTVILFVNLCNYLITPIQVVPEYAASRMAAKGLIGKLAELVCENSVPSGKYDVTDLRKDISLCGLGFGYEPGKPVLRGLSCTFEKGKCYAIVGASGSGKTTLLHLLMGAFGEYEGSLSMDGRELKEIAPGSLYRMISLISQNVFVFDDTIRNNITMFSQFPDEEVERAICLAGLEPVLRAKGEDFRCGENGANLSGGERQRISIARSLLKGADVLLVDEATSALDSETAQHVSEAILGLSGLTRIVVTHRIDAPVFCQYDGILMLKDGILCEQGRFEELMERKGQFYSLYTVSGRS